MHLKDPDLYVLGVFEWSSHVIEKCKGPTGVRLSLFLNWLLLLTVFVFLTIGELGGLVVMCWSIWILYFITSLTLIEGITTPERNPLEREPVIIMARIALPLFLFYCYLRAPLLPTLYVALMVCAVYLGSCTPLQQETTAARYECGFFYYSFFATVRTQYVRQRTKAQLRFH